MTKPLSSLTCFCLALWLPSCVLDANLAQRSSEGGAGGGGDTGGSAGTAGRASGGTGAACSGPDCDCEELGCAPAPICGESCSSPCGCCDCTPGTSKLIGGVRHTCRDGCFESVRPCMMAASDYSCCTSAVPVSSSEVVTDPCLRPFPRVAAASEEVCPDPASCDMLCGPEPYPVPRLAAPGANDECEVVDECTTDADCRVATSYLDCCGCPHAFPAEMVASEPCIAKSPPDPDAGCADCSATNCAACPGDALVAACEPNDAGVRVCVPVPVVTSLASLPGGTFFLFGSRADSGDAACSEHDSSTAFSLAFSADGETVTAVWLGQPSESVHEGRRTASTGTSVRYAMDENWAGGELVLEVVAGVVVARLEINGSGVPVVVCLRAPLEFRR